MRQIFSKKQLFVIWFVGIVVCFFVLQSSIIIGGQAEIIYGRGFTNWKIYYHGDLAINWLRLTLIPIIIGALLVISFSKDSRQNKR